MLRYLPIPQVQVADKAVKITWWVSVLAIIIALILIIISIVLFSKGSNGAGFGLLITGIVIGGIAGYTYKYTNRSLDDIALENIQKGPAGQLLNKVFGKGDSEDDLETVVSMDIQKKGGCPCGGDDESESFNDEIDETKFLESE